MKHRDPRLDGAELHDPRILPTAIKVHGQLSELIAPATPASIRASSFRGNPTLQVIAAVSVLSTVIFLGPILFNSSSRIAHTLQMLGAAGLGATFYAFITASVYLRHGTFDPKLQTFYLVRLMIGIISGLILAFFGPEMIGAEEEKRRLSQAAFALVGGFSSEAVVQILQRVAETLVTAVKGTAKAKMKAESDQALKGQSTEIAARLQTLVGSAKTDDGLREEIAELAADLLRRTRSL